MAATAAGLAELPSWLSHEVTEVSAAAPATGTTATTGESAQVTLYLTGHTTVVWGGADRASQKDKELALLMRDHGRYFDVSAPGTVVTR